MTQIALAREILRQLAHMGVGEAVVCAGARNAPFVRLLENAKGWTIHGFFEERSAGFFALGRARRAGRPVVVCTTSGTAVAELLPAVIEADYQRVPLIVLSADRPRTYRDSGAPQTIHQPGIFSQYVENCFDVESEPPPLQISGLRPVHVNVCFKEPLIDEAISAWELTPNSIARTPALGVTVPIEGRAPLVLVSSLTPEQADEVLPILLSWRRPVYAEATSQLKGRLGEWEVLSPEPLSHLHWDSVIRIGGIPTLRYWRDLEEETLPVWHFSEQSWCGLPREREVHSLAAVSQVQARFEPWAEAERSKDRRRANERDQLLEEFPLSEPAWVRVLSGQVPSESFVFVGNSLPIREWDFAARGGFEVAGNRGVNGIDGLVSTFLGMAESKRENWAVLGDLSALYDLSGLWAARTIAAENINLVVLNNGGGKIFSRMFDSALFENRHELEFSSWAKMWGWAYTRLASRADQWPPTGGRRIIEIVPDHAQTLGFYKRWEQAR